MNNTVKKISGIALAAAAASVFVAGCATESSPASSGKVACAGINACKGLSDCKTASSSCKGQNSCKGHGFVFMGADECSKIK
ncbi:MAG: BufA2 family periplasmic bufferin-type metallophore [Burkholderiales bacterium]